MPPSAEIGCFTAATVHVVDDDEAVCLALDSLLRSVGYDTRMYASVAQFVDVDRGEGPGCLILDVRLPGMGGLDFQAQLAVQDNALPVILMTGHGDIPMSVRAMKAGAVDFLSKPFRDQDMLDAVSEALDRDRCAREEATTRQSLRRNFASLSQREKAVMALVTEGKMNKQVAGDLSLSEITVKVHRAAAMRKMCARTLADLVRMAECLRLHD